MNSETLSINLQETMRLLQDNSSQIQLLDVRSKEEYEKQHIPDAINLSGKELESIVNNKDLRSKTVITICNHGNQRSQSAAQLLREHGFENAVFLEGGTAGWFDGPVQ